MCGMHMHTLFADQRWPINSSQRSCLHPSKSISIHGAGAQCGWETPGCLSCPGLRVIVESQLPHRPVPNRDNVIDPVSHQLQITSYQLQITSYQLKITSVWQTSEVPGLVPAPGEAVPAPPVLRHGGLHLPGRLPPTRHPQGSRG